MEGSNDEGRQQRPSCSRCKARDWWWHLIFPLPLFIKIACGVIIAILLYSCARLCYDYDAYVGELREMSTLRGRFDPVVEFGPWSAVEQAHTLLSALELTRGVMRMNWTILRNLPAILMHHAIYGSYNPITHAEMTALRVRVELQVNKHLEKDGVSPLQ